MINIAITYIHDYSYGEMSGHQSCRSYTFFVSEMVLHLESCCSVLLCHKKITPFILKVLFPGGKIVLTIDKYKMHFS